MSVNSHTLLQPPASHQLTQENAQKRKNNKTKIAETNLCAYKNITNKFITNKVVTSTPYVSTVKCQSVNLSKKYWPILCFALS